MTVRPTLLLGVALAACADPPPDLVIVATRDAAPGKPAAIVGVEVRDGAIVDRDELYLAPTGALILDAATSDDGRWLAFATSGGSDPGVFVVDTHGDRRTKVSDEALVDRLFFAPRNEALVFDARALAAEPDAVRFVVPLGDGVGEPVQVQDAPAETMLPSFAADLDTMVFVEGTDVLVVVRALATAPSATIAMQDAAEIDTSDLELTPDGRNVSFRARAEPGALARLFTIDLAGDLPSAGVPLVEVLGDDTVFGPVTAPDGRGVASTVVDGDALEPPSRALMWTELVEGAPANPRMVARLDPDTSSVDRFTPDGRWLLVPARGGAPQGITLVRAEPDGEWPSFTLPFPAGDVSLDFSTRVSSDGSQAGPMRMRASTSSTSVTRRCGSIATSCPS